MSLTLYFSKTSPFARKVRIALIELGLHEEVRSIEIDPFNAGPDYFAVNPLSKIPTLITHEGVALPDSRLILDYLHSLDDALLRAQQGADIWTLRKLQQYADGVIEAAAAGNLEKRRDPAKFSEGWLNRQVAAIQRTLDVLEQHAGLLRHTDPLSPLEITTVAALGYLDLRHANLAWREGRGGLAAWYEQIGTRPSVQATSPTA